MTEVIMPKMGDGMEEGTLNEWLKKDGEKVKSGEVIGTIQTDKATLELEAPASGVLTGILLQAGGTVPVGKAIAAILKDGESLPSGWGSGSSTPAAPAAEAAPVAEAPATASAPVATTAVSERIKASPLAKKIARDRGIDLAGITGSGPDGRIVQKDVLGATPGSAPAPAATKAPAFAPIAASAEDTTFPLNKIRQITAKRTQESKQQVPHFYVTVEVDVEKILALREMFEEEESGKVSINDFVVKASALALRDMPQVNAAFQGDKLLIHGGVHIGIAVALEDGLTVPVVKNVDLKPLRQINAEVRDLAKRAKDNKLSMDELSGSTFSISNMGMLDVDNFLAIVNQPNAAIVAIASVRKRVVVNDEGEIEVRSKMNITGSFDHRVADGAIGAKFINVIKSYLENPTRLLQ
ncbi:MAG: pyruvate dehydrogenase complex dihydrolipoamide acetyltransferase [Armatimonadetes bacterium]|nr:pyruvate dehydrogenase complex dihydrolipoamide acetyltransferase [Armatimonadota bacterium]